MMRSDQAPYGDERQTSGATDFDAALEAFLAGGDSEALLRAAAIVLECDLPLPQVHTDAISNGRASRSRATRMPAMPSGVGSQLWMKRLG